MSRYLQQIAPGGMKYREFAIGRLRALSDIRARLRLRTMSKQWLIGSSHIWVKSSDEGDIIRITGGGWNYFFRQTSPTRNWIGIVPLQGEVHLAPVTKDGGFWALVPGSAFSNLSNLGSFLSFIATGTQGGAYRTVYVLDPNEVSSALEWRTKAELDAEAAGGPPTPAPTPPSGPQGLQLQATSVGLNDHIVAQTDTEQSGTQLRYQRPAKPAVKLASAGLGKLMVTSRQDIALLGKSGGKTQAWDLDGGALGPELNIVTPSFTLNTHDGAGVGGWNFRMTYHDVLHVYPGTFDINPLSLTWTAVRNNVVLSHPATFSFEAFIAQMHTTKTSGYFFYTSHYTNDMAGNVSIRFSWSRMIGTLNPSTGEVDYALSNVDDSVINLSGTSTPTVSALGGTGLRSRAVEWFNTTTSVELAEDVFLITQFLYSLDSDGVRRVVESGVNQGLLYNSPIVIPIGDTPVLFVVGASGAVRVYSDTGFLRQFTGPYSSMSYFGTRAGAAYVRGARVDGTVWLLGTDGVELNLTQAALDYGFTNNTAFASGLAARSTQDTLFVMGVGTTLQGNPPVSTVTIAHVTHAGTFATHAVIPGITLPFIGTIGIGLGTRSPLLRYAEEDVWY